MTLYSLDGRGRRALRARRRRESADGTPLRRSSGGARRSFRATLPALGAPQRRQRPRGASRSGWSSASRADEIAAGLATFRGVKRRLEVRGTAARRHGRRRLRPPPDRRRHDARRREEALPRPPRLGRLRAALDDGRPGRFLRALPRGALERRRRRPRGARTTPRASRGRAAPARSTSRRSSRSFAAEEGPRRSRPKPPDALLAALAPELRSGDVVVVDVLRRLRRASAAKLLAAGWRDRRRRACEFGLAPSRRSPRGVPTPLDPDLDASARGRAAPTPSGVPVRITSPGSSVIACETHATSVGTSKIIPTSSPTAVTAPSTSVSRRRSDGSTSVSIAGPSGQNVSKPFARHHWPSVFWRSRAVTSSAQRVAEDGACRLLAREPPARAFRSRRPAPPRSRRATTRAAGGPSRRAGGATTGGFRKTSGFSGTSFPSSAACAR